MRIQGGRVVQDRGGSYVTNPNEILIDLGVRKKLGERILLLVVTCYGKAKEMELR